MTKEQLDALEHQMTKKEIMERAKTLRPIAEFERKGGMRFWLNVDKIATFSYTWDIKPLKPTGYLLELGRVKTFHRYGHPSLFKPSVDECVCQCPYPEATAFMILVDTAEIDFPLNRHTAITVYFTGDMPEDIKNRKIVW